MDRLDGLRAIAALAVVLHHWLPATHFLKELRIPLGNIGIQFFFVLSGFLITHILLKEKKLIRSNAVTFAGAVKRFFIGRAFRILPLYFFGLLLLVIFSVSPSTQYLGWHVAFSSNILKGLYGVQMPFSGHYWSLAVEWKFYLIWPFSIFFLNRRTLLVVTFLLILLAPFFRYYAAQIFDVPNTQVLLLGSVDSLALGAMISLLGARSRRHDLTPYFQLIAGLSLWASCYAPVLGGVQPIGQASALYVTGMALTFSGALWLILRNEKSPISRILEIPALTYLGRISFGIYVYHVLVLGLAPTIVRDFDLDFLRPLLPSFWFRASLTILLAVASWHFMEKPFIRISNRLRKSRHTQGHAAGTIQSKSGPSLS